MSFNGGGREISAWRRKIKLLKNEATLPSAVALVPRWFAEGSSPCLEAGLPAGRVVAMARKRVSHRSAPTAAPRLQPGKAVGEPTAARHGHRLPGSWLPTRLPRLHGWVRRSLAPRPGRPLPMGDARSSPHRAALPQRRALLAPSRSANAWPRAGVTVPGLLRQTWLLLTPAEFLLPSCHPTWDHLARPTSQAIRFPDNFTPSAKTSPGRPLLDPSRQTHHPGRHVHCMGLSIPALRECAETVGDMGTRGEAGLCNPWSEAKEGRQVTFLSSSLICDLGEVVMRWSIGAAAF